MKEVVKKEALKLLDVGVIYPIADSKWVSPTQVVPKKSGVAVVENEYNELLPTRVIDYRKLNAGYLLWTKCWRESLGMSFIYFLMVTLGTIKLR